jgi:hypothetical protein
VVLQNIGYRKAMSNFFFYRSPVDCPGTACRSPGLSHSQVRSAIHCRASEFNKTQSHERSLIAIRANRDFRKEPGVFRSGVFRWVF